MVSFFVATLDYPFSELAKNGSISYSVMRASRTLQNMGLSNEMNVVNGISCVAKAPQTTFKWCAVDRGRGEDRERQVNEGCEV
jgi:hypothetical protein